MPETLDPEECAAAFVAAARSYVGWALIPLNGKVPRSSSWQTATPESDLDLVAGKWSEWGKRYAMGVVLGPSGLEVIEDDLADGHERLLELFGGALPATPIVVSGGNSLHLYFVDGGHGNAARDGLELRAGNQQCVLPPSVHATTGRPYRWLEGHEPWTLAPIAIPGAVLAYFGTTGAKKKAAPIGDVIPEGSRHRTLLSIAGSMRRRGISERAILVALLVENEKCRPAPLPEHEVVAIARDVARRYQPAPPDSVQDQLEEQARRLLEREPAGDEEDVLSRARARPAAPLIVSLVEFLGGNEDDAAWLVDHLAARGALVVIAGLPKVGKSTFVYGLLGAVTSANDRFVGLPAGSTSALLMTEEPPATVEEKVDRFGVDDEKVFVISKRKMGAGRPWPKTVAAAIAFCRVRPEVGVCVVDTWDKFVGLSSSKSETDTGTIVEMIEPLYELLGLGVCVILITHQRKAEGEYGLRVRVGTALTGSADVIVEVERPSQSTGLSGAARVVKIVSRFAGAPDEMAVELEERGWRSLGPVKAAARRSRREEVLALLGEEPLVLEDVHERFGGPSRDTVRRRLGELVEHGLAERVGDGKRSDPYRWKLSEGGHNPAAGAENAPSDLFASSPSPRGEAACKETFGCPRHPGEHEVTNRAAAYVFLSCGCRLLEDEL